MGPNQSIKTPTSGATSDWHTQMVVLDPFAGSGPVLEACIDAGVQSISIEAEGTFVPLILERVHCAQARLAA